VAEIDEVTVLVVIVKLAFVLPAVTETEAGTVTEALLLESETGTPPDGAAPLKVMVPVAGVPPVTLEGLTEMDDRVTVKGVMLSAAVLLAPL